MKADLLQAEDVHRVYRRGPSLLGGSGLKAVDGVSFTISAGQVFGIVGESGCGKSTLARIAMALDRPTRGRVRFDGHDLFAAGRADLRRLRRGFQMVFQDPYGSIDPRMRTRSVVAEPLHLDPRLRRAERRALVAETLASVGLRPEDGERYAHEFSGGQRQRIAIARALVTRPRLVVADEPVSALDLSIRAQVLNLLRDLQERHQLALLFISHDLAVVEYMAHVLAVMYLGRFVEVGPAAGIFREPAHPYTRLLLDSVLTLDLRNRRRRPAAPPGASPGRGCAFAPRCPQAVARCREEIPALRSIGPGRAAACHLA